MAEPREIVVFGTGDFARTALAYLHSGADYRVVAFTANSEYIDNDHLVGVPVVPFETLTKTHPPERYGMFVAIGFSRVNKARRAVYEDVKRLGYELVSYVDSRAHLTGDVQIGDNCFIFEANVLQPNVRIGNNVIIWSGNHIGHDSAIGITASSRPTS